MRRTMPIVAIAIALTCLSATAALAASPSNGTPTRAPSDSLGPLGTVIGGTETAVEVAVPPQVRLTVEPVARFNPSTGSVSLAGTVTCLGADVIDGALDVFARQKVARSYAEGGDSYSLGCDNTLRSWMVEITPETGLFKGGRAYVSVFASACTEMLCGSDLTQLTVGVRR